MGLRDLHQQSSRGSEIQPERQEEFEGGIDATLANGRAELNLTIYQRNIRDLILEQTIAPSVGQEFRVFGNGGRLRNRGVEASLTLQPVQSRSVNWIFRTTFFANRATITELNVPAFETGGFGTVAWRTSRSSRAASPTQIGHRCEEGTMREGRRRQP